MSSHYTTGRIVLNFIAEFLLIVGIFTAVFGSFETTVKLLLISIALHKIY